jgi:hypothetical protein
LYQRENHVNANSETKQPDAFAYIHAARWVFTETASQKQLLECLAAAADYKTGESYWPVHRLASRTRLAKSTIVRDRDYLKNVLKVITVERRFNKPSVTTLDLARLRELTKEGEAQKRAEEAAAAEEVARLRKKAAERRAAKKSVVADSTAVEKQTSFMVS